MINKNEDLEADGGKSVSGQPPGRTSPNSFVFYFEINCHLVKIAARCKK
jgi:hypothetical protein